MEFLLFIFNNNLISILFFFIKFNFIFFDEKTPLHLAVENGDIDIVKILMNNKNIDLNAEDEIRFYNCQSSLESFFNNFFVAFKENQLIAQKIQK